VIVLAGITVMMIMMGAAVPTWRYIMQDDREQELYFRGDQIARAVEEYQRKNGNAFPPSFEVLIKGKFLRRQYKDPMVKGGKWRIVRPGEAVPVAGLPASGPGGASPRPSPTPPPSAFGPPGGTAVGAIAGVASTSHENSLRLFNGRTRYDQWIFLAGQPRLLGRNTAPNVPGAGGGLGASPGSGQRPPSAAPLR
jgi:type II secretory pathway pseudopilin PulG